MLRFKLCFSLLLFGVPFVLAQSNDLARWNAEAKNVTVTRDNWGIAHIHGKTDADAVFGAEYAQAEDDFHRIEMNYVNAMGRMAEIEGESKIYADLRMKLFIDPAAMQTIYAGSPPWLQKLMDAFADGLNFYLYKHPEVKPALIQHFEPWMALTFSEGSIGGDIERIDLQQLESFYDGARKGGREIGTSTYMNQDEEPRGSNGIAIAPSHTANGHALLLINPHTSFYFRSELQMQSNEGLDAYGAVTWGQFFIYQGWNEHAGWMHTSSGADAIDEYRERVTKNGTHFQYLYKGSKHALIERSVTVPYKTEGGMKERRFTVYRTGHGPVVREENGAWITIRLMQEPLQALIQSYTRTKARSYAEFRQSMEGHTNSSNNTIFADDEGDIAYFHANFIPKRNPQFDWTKPVDGTISDTDWHGVLSVDESPKLLNPRNGWLFNVNNSPWSAAGADSPRREDFPRYVENGTESARGLHAIRVLNGQSHFTLDSLVTAAYDSYLPWFDKTLPTLERAYAALPQTDTLASQLREPIAQLQQWDHRWSADSVPTSLAVFWAEDLRTQYDKIARNAHLSLEDYAVTRVPAHDLVGSLAAAVHHLQSDFGTWKTPWGHINRFQRLDDNIDGHFDDGKPSIPVPFTSSIWGSLAAFGAHPYPNTKRWYGNVGNSFVAAVEFGPKIRARAVTAGGESGKVNSPHFDDEAQRYSTGNLREVYFYEDQLRNHTERSYHPGASKQ